MAGHALTPAQADLEQTILNAEAESISSSDLYAWLRESGLPSEAAIRLKSLIDVTMEVAGRVVYVGKIILIKIIEFVKVHRHLAIGVAIGAAIGALVSAVPILGTYLAPIAMAFGVAVGAIAGHRLDKLADGQAVSAEFELIAIGRDVIEIAMAFFQLLIDIFNAALDGQVLKGA